MVGADVCGAFRVELVEINPGGGIARSRVRCGSSAGTECFEFFINRGEAFEMGWLAGLILSQMRCLPLRSQRLQGLDRLRAGRHALDLHMGMPMRQGLWRRARSRIVLEIVFGNVLWAEVGLCVATPVG